MRRLTIKNRRIFNKVQSYFIVIVAIILVYTLITSAFYINVLQNEAITRYTVELEKVSEFIDTSIHEIMKNVSLIEYTQDLTTILYSNQELSKQEYSTVQKGYNFVNRLRATKEFINNVYILHKPNNLSIASDGTSSIQEYYDINGMYEEYDADYFINIKPDGESVKILKPTTVSKMNRVQDAEVIPMVIFDIGGRRLQNYIFVDLNKSEITKLLMEYRATPNSTMFIYDKKNDYIIEHNSIVGDTFNDEVTSKILANSDDVFYFNNEGRRYMAIKYNANVNFDQYEYVALVPVFELYIISLQQFAMPSVLILVSLLLMFSLLFIFSKRVTGPIQKLVNVLKENNLSNGGKEDTGNEIEFINHEINKIITDNKKLTDDISEAMPYVYERYLISILNNNTILTKDEISSIINRHDFTFEYEYFCAVLTNIHFSEEFYENYSNEDYRRICENILLAQKNVFPKGYVNYVLSIGKSQICIVINLKNKNKVEDIVSYADEFYKSFELEERYITIQSGVGNVYKELTGLQKSYQEASKAIIINVPNGTNQKVKSFKEIDALSSFSYTFDEENKLLNLLLKGEKEKAKALYDRVMDKNLKNNLSNSALKELYMYLYNTGIRVINRLNITPYDLMGDKYINVISDVNSMSITDLESYLELFLNKIVEYSHKTRSYRIDADELKAYFEKNYNRDMYLDKIAEDFDISSTNISKMIKNALGMSFQKYISRLRIDKAKEMLKTTDKSIDNIAAETGYNSRHTFIRMFKLLEGITPSDYRKINN